MATAAPTRPTPSPAFHIAKAREAEQQSRNLSVRFTTSCFTSQFSDGATPDELAALKEARDSFSRLAQAHYQAARRVERARRIRRLFAPVTRIARLGGGV